MDILYTSTNAVTDFTDPNVIYWANGYPLKYSVFAVNLTIILVHIGIAALNGLMIEAIRRSRQVEEPAGHCLISEFHHHCEYYLLIIHSKILKTQMEE